MTWSEIRDQFPNSWLLVEAIEAHSANGHRIVTSMSVISLSDDSPEAMDKYGELHRIYPQREYYVLHTSNEKLVIRERRWHGIRSLA